MGGDFAALFGVGAAALVKASSERPYIVISLCAALTAASLYVTVTVLEVDTDSDRILSSDLPVRQTNIALAEAFPELQNNLILMIDGDDSADARAAAEQISERLAREPDRYPGVFLPGEDLSLARLVGIVG